MYLALTSAGGDRLITPLSDDGAAGAPARMPAADLPGEVARLEAQHPRWVWADTSRWYPALLAAGVRVERCVDLRLSHAILRHSELTAASALATAVADGWDAATPDALEQQPEAALFELVEPVPAELEDPLAEFRLQREAVASAKDPRRISLLLGAESAGSLVAAEMQFAGLPWRADRHDRLLTGLLGPRPRPGERPALLEATLHRVREALQAPELNPDSPPDLLKALGRAGLVVASTRSWELKKLTHPAIAPLLEYKKLARLLAANGWHWLDANVADGRFHPDYVVGGVVTGRWASKGGGGALQLPKQIRGAVVADPGWKLVVADASQLEPRILAAMSGDVRMAEAGREQDMYAGILASGAVATRAEAKVAMLGAMYGSTTGDSGRLMPKLTRAYPRAIALVEAAARAGERGQIVSTRLGRSSPRPGPAWRETQSKAYGDRATDADRRRARSEARTWGRFTRNFVVQGTAAEWALCWMASLRRTLRELGGDAWLTDAPHLVFFLHDELVVHCPAQLADAVAEAMQAASTEAAQLLFGATQVEFPLSVDIVDNYAQAK